MSLRMASSEVQRSTTFPMVKGLLMWVYGLIYSFFLLLRH
jgi:hypothetical protein